MSINGEIGESGVPRAPGSRLARIVRRWWLAVPLVVLVVAAFLPILDNAFVSFDDDENFLENANYRGLGWRQVRWAWTTFLLGVYQPLAWLLLEAEYVVWGLDPRGYHLTSLALHAIVAVVLYVLNVALLDRSLAVPDIGDRARIHLAASLAAAGFAVHPLRVEVVAWASCQPYLPCALFAMLAVLAYLRANDPGGSSRKGWLCAAWLSTASALLFKAAAVGVPFLLPILDVYPLRRMGPGNRGASEGRRAWREKVPFLALALAFMVLAVLGKQSNESLWTVKSYGPAGRALQSCYGLWFYLVKTLLPFDLSAYYPLPRQAELLRWPFLLSVSATIAAGAIAFRLRRRLPGLLAAWTAYLVLLAPNLGIIPIGNQVAADRYSYIASMAWGAPAAWAILQVIDRSRGRPRLAALLGVAVLGTLTALTISTRRQCTTWKATEALWTQVLEHGGQRVAAAHFNLGADLSKRGKDREALAQLAEALRLAPESADAHNILGAALDRLGRSGEAIAEYVEAIRLDPGYADAHYNLGAALARRGDLREAVVELGAAVRLKPTFILARRNFARALARQGRLKEAIVEYQAAARLEPDRAETRNDLGLALAQRGRLDEAIAEFSEASRLDPGSAASHTNLGLALAQRGRLDEAIAHYAEAARLEPRRVENRLLLGEALVRLGKSSEAAAHFAEALKLDPGGLEARRALEEIRRGSRQGQTQP